MLLSKHHKNKVYRLDEIQHHQPARERCMEYVSIACTLHFGFFLPTKCGFSNLREQSQAPPHLHSAAKHIGDISNCL